MLLLILPLLEDMFIMDFFWGGPCCLGFELMTGISILLLLWLVLCNMIYIYICGVYLFPYVAIWLECRKLHQNQAICLCESWPDAPGLDPRWCTPLLGFLSLDMRLGRPGLGFLVWDWEGVLQGDTLELWFFRWKTYDFLEKKRMFLLNIGWSNHLNKIGGEIGPRQGTDTFKSRPGAQRCLILISFA